MEVQKLVKQRVPLRVEGRDIGLAARIESLARQPSESTADYTNRAADLSYQAHDTQLEKSRNRLYRHMVAGGHNSETDIRIQDRGTDRLYSCRLINDVGELDKACAFQ